MAFKNTKIRTWTDEREKKFFIVFKSFDVLYYITYNILYLHYFDVFFFYQIYVRRDKRILQASHNGVKKSSLTYYWNIVCDTTQVLSVKCWHPATRPLEDFWSSTQPRETVLRDSNNTFYTTKETISVIIYYIILYGKRNDHVEFPTIWM